jgi:hypothetical protein
VRLFSAITVDAYDHFEADVTDSDDPEHGVIRLREFSIQGEPAALRRLAAAAMNAADLAEKASTTGGQ